MKPDPKAEAQRWLRPCFLPQQSAEKALAYLRGARFVPSHSVVELMKSLKEPYPQLSQFTDFASRLDQYYIATRYPNALPGAAPFEVFSKSQAEEAVEMARGIINEAGLIITKQ